MSRQDLRSLQWPSILVKAVVCVREDPLSTCDSPADLEHLLTRFIADPHHERRFLDVAQPHLLRFAGRFAANLPQDLRQDVVNETLVSILELAPGAFDSTRGSATTFLQLLVRHAARKVRAGHCPPGQRTRSRWDARGTAEAPLDDILADQPTATMKRAPIDLLTQLAARQVMRRAPAVVRRVLYSIHFEGRTLRETARRAGVDHGSLGRQVRAFSSKARAAA